jgi:acetoacetyl-CoA synthetase
MVHPEPFSSPSSEQTARANITQFIKFVNQRHSLRLDSFTDLHAWSCNASNDFWTAIWDWTTVIGDKGAPPLFDDSPPFTDTTHLLPRAKLNWAENMLLSHPAARSTTKIALVGAVEPDPTLDPVAQRTDYLRSTISQSLTYSQLYDAVVATASRLKSLGVGPGDTVGAFSPNNVEAVVFVLATSAIGAIWSEFSSVFRPLLYCAYCFLGHPHLRSSARKRFENVSHR